MNLKFLFFFCLTLNALLTACGGGGGGSEGSNNSSNTPVYLNVTSSSPSNNQNQIAYNKNIEISFSEDINENALVNLDADISGLLETKGIIATKTILADASSTDRVTIDGLKKGNFKLSWKDSPENLLIITQASWSGSGDSKSLSLSHAAGTIDFSASELKAAQLDKEFQNIISLTSNGMNIPFSLSINGRKILLDPVDFFQWKTIYSVKVQSSILSVNNRAMKSDYAFQFTSEIQPDLRIINKVPIGLEANPMKPIDIFINFEPNVDSLAAAIEVNKVIPEGADAVQIQLEMARDLAKAKIKKASTYSKNSSPSVSYEDNSSGLESVQGTISYDSINRIIKFTPDNEFEYATKYVVKINKGTSKITGTVGLSPEAELLDSAEWDFTTQTPKVVATLPVDEGEPNDYNYLKSVNTNIDIEFNYRPKPGQVNSDTIRVTDNYGNEYHNLKFNVDSTKVSISPDPSIGRWEYGRVYSVKVTTDVVADNRSSTYLPEAYTFWFSTERRKVIAVSPWNGSTSVAENNLEVKVSFNFDVDPSSIDSDSFLLWSDGKRISGNYSYDSENRVAVFKANGSFLYNQKFTAEVTERISDVDSDYSIYSGFDWHFEIRNLELKIANSNPKKNDSYVPVLSEIEIVLNYPLKSESVKTGYGSISKAVTAKYDGCGGSYIYGYTYWDGAKTLQFIPDSIFKSDCRVVIELDDDIRGTLGQEPEDEIKFSFDTDFVEVDQIYYYGSNSNNVEIDTNLEVYFSHDMEYIGSYDISFYEGGCSSGSSKSVSTSTSGNKLTVQPYSTLRYDHSYCLVLKAGNIEAKSGEELVNTYQFSFNTESMPLDIIDYGPTGSYVPVNSDFWVLTNFSTSHSDFPYWSGSISGVSVSEYEYGNEVSIQPSFYDLDYNTSYYVNFNFPLGDGDVSVSWSVTTEDDPYLYTDDGVGYSSKVSKDTYKNSTEVLKILEKYKKGCLANTSCNLQSSVERPNAGRTKGPTVTVRYPIKKEPEHQDRLEKRKEYQLEKALEVKNLE